MSLVHGYISINKFDIICLSETYLDSSISFNDGSLDVPGYTLVSADNPNNTKRGGVCIYNLNSLPLKVLDIQSSSECVTIEKNIVKNCATFFVYIDHLVKLETPLRHLLIILN